MSDGDDTVVGLAQFTKEQLLRLCNQLREADSKPIKQFRTKVDALSRARQLVAERGLDESNAALHRSGLVAAAVTGDTDKSEADGDGDAKSDAELAAETGSAEIAEGDDGMASKASRKKKAPRRKREAAPPKERKAKASDERQTIRTLMRDILDRRIVPPDEDIIEEVAAAYPKSKWASVKRAPGLLAWFKPVYKRGALHGDGKKREFNQPVRSREEKQERAPKRRRSA